MHILILSRFNTVQRHVVSDRALRRMNSRRFDSTWQRKRIELMKHFTSPSVKSQTDNNYSWHVFVQDGTRQSVIDEIKLMGAHITITDEDDVAAAQKLVRRRRGPVVTINLDTDDAITPRFIEQVRQYINKPKNETLVFLRGVRYRPIPPWAATTKSETNPFNIRVETKAQEAETVFSFPHGKVDRVLDPRTPMWMQVIHGENMDNITMKRTRKDKNLGEAINKMFTFIPMPQSGTSNMQRTAYGRYLSNEVR